MGLLPGRPFAGVLGQPQGLYNNFEEISKGVYYSFSSFVSLCRTQNGVAANSGGSALAQGEADGALYANTQNLGATIPVSPWGGRISLAGSRSVAVGNLFGQPGGESFFLCLLRRIFLSLRNGSVPGSLPTSLDIVFIHFNARGFICRVKDKNQV